MLSNISHTVRNTYAGQTGASCKGVISDRCHAVRDCHAGQVGTSLEHIITNARHFIRDHDGTASARIRKQCTGFADRHRPILSCVRFCRRGIVTPVRHRRQRQRQQQRRRQKNCPYFFHFCPRSFFDFCRCFGGPGSGRRSARPAIARRRRKNGVE